MIQQITTTNIGVLNSLILVPFQLKKKCNFIRSDEWEVLKQISLTGGQSQATESFRSKFTANL